MALGPISTGDVSASIGAEGGTAGGQSFGGVSYAPVPSVKESNINLYIIGGLVLAGAVFLIIRKKV